MNIEPDCTRIDLERQAENVMISKWFGKWREGSSSTVMEYAPNTRLESLLDECKRAGFTVWMDGSFHGRALRGEITRVDVLLDNHRWVGSKWPYGWSPKTQPIVCKELTECEAQNAIQWLKDHGWTVHDYHNGARAQLGEFKPVMDGASTAHLRRRIEKNFRNYGELDPRRNLNLALDAS